MRVFWLISVLCVSVACSGTPTDPNLQQDGPNEFEPDTPKQGDPTPAAPRDRPSEKEPAPDSSGGPDSSGSQDASAPVQDANADSGPDGAIVGDGGTDAALSSDGGKDATPTDGGSAETGASDGSVDAAVDASVCVSGQARCVGSASQSCVSGQWGTMQSCPYVCSAGACTGVCTPGAGRCNGTTSETCSTLGQWQTNQVCPFVCAGNGACSGSCSPGTTRCNGQAIEGCNASGQWEVTSTCQYQCSSGLCTGVCNPGETKCNGSSVQTCSQAAKWEVTSTCPYACSAGACTGTCTPGAKRCGGAGVETCSSLGQWVGSETCAYQCTNNACVGSCTPGTQRCNGLEAQTCGSNGEWQTDMTCPFICKNGVGCTGGCAPGSTQCASKQLYTCNAEGSWDFSYNCPSGPNGTSSCSSFSSCGYTCNAGRANCNGAMGDGCEVNTDTDVNNCGSCGHVCTEGTCSAGKCQPTTLASGESGANSLLIDNTSVYWTAGTSQGSVLRRLVKTDGSLSTIYTHTGVIVNQTRLVGNRIYFTGSGSTLNTAPLFSVATTGGSATPYSNSETGGATGFWTDGSLAFWVRGVSPDTLTQYNLSNQSRSNLISGSSAPPMWHMESDASFIYWAQGTLNDNTHPAHSIYKLQKGVYGATSQPCMTSAMTKYVYDMVLNGSNLFWIDYNGFGIYKLATSCASETKLATSPSRPVSVATDGAYVYWAGRGVWRVPVGGGATETIVEAPALSSSPSPYNEPFIFHLAVDSTHVYWIETTGTVKRIRKDP